MDTAPPHNAPGKLHGYGAALAMWMDAHERLCLWLTLAIFAAFALYRALTTPLWFDELFTLFISRLTSWPEFVRAMPVDNQPPLGDLLTHITMRLFGEHELPVRLPELFAYALSGLLTYRIVRRRGAAVQALFAMALLLGASVNKIQAITARPYELMLLMTAIVFACWQAAASRQRRRLWPLCGLALGVAGAVLTHHFAIIQIGALLAAGEATRLIQRRRPDWAMLAAILIGLSPLAFTVRIMRASRQLLGEPILHSHIFWARPTLASLKSYQTMAALPLLLLVVAFAALLWRTRFNIQQPQSSPPSEALPGSKTSAHLVSGHDFSRARDFTDAWPALSPPAHASKSAVAPHEWAATLALSLLVPIQVVLTSVATNYYLPRYAIGTSLGLALLFAWGLPTLTNLRAISQPVLAASTACFVLSVAVTLAVAQVKRPFLRADFSQTILVPLHLRDLPVSLPLVVANGLDYAQKWWYATPDMQARMVYLYDVNYAEQKRDPLPELSLSEGAFYIPMNVQPYAPFLATHAHFLLLAEGDPRLLWLPQRLRDEGWRLEILQSSQSSTVYDVSR